MRSPLNIKISKQRCKINSFIHSYGTKNPKGCSLLIFLCIFLFNYLIFNCLIHPKTSTCCLYVGLVSFMPILIRGKYTNNSLNDNWLRKILIVKSSKTATWPKREFQVSFHIDFWSQTTGNQIEIIIYPVYKYSTRKKCIFATEVTLCVHFKIPAPPHFLSVLF